MGAEVKNGELPADISQGEWDAHRGEVARVSGELGALDKQIARLNRNLEMTNGSMRSLGLRIDALDKRLRQRDARLDKLEDWKEDTGRHELATLEAELKEVRAERKRRVWFVVKVVGGVLAAVAEAAILHWMHWGAP